MFSLRAKQRPIPSISLRSPHQNSNFISVSGSFQPDFLSVFHDEDTVSPQEIHIG